MDGSQIPLREKDVYEYIPEASSSKSVPDASTRISFFQKAGGQSGGGDKDIRSDVIDTAVEPHMAYVQFREASRLSDSRDKTAVDAFPLLFKKDREEFEVMPSFVLSSMRPCGRGKEGEETVAHTAHSDSIEDAACPRTLGEMAKARDENLFISKVSGYSQFETPLGRISRLENELKELHEYISAQIEKASAASNVQGSDHKSTTRLQAEINANQSFFGMQPLTLLSEIETLQAHISSLKGDTRVHSLLASIDPITSKESGYDALIQHLDIAAAGKMTEDEEMKGTLEQTKDNFMEYELYPVPTMKPLLESSRMVALESRIAELENKIGISKISLLPYFDISTAVSELSKRISAFDTQRIEAISKRVQALLVDIQSIQARRRDLDESDTSDQKLDFLYALCFRWRHLAAAIPIVVKRLQTLKMLHQESSGIAARMKLVESQQNDLKVLAESTRNGFETLQQSMTESIEWAKRTVEGLERRIESLRQGR